MSNKVYTKKGDDGTTSLLSGKRISKTSSEIKSVGVLDELNSFIGLLRSETNIATEILEEVQWNLFNAGSIVINDNNLNLPEVTEKDIELLEGYMDSMSKELPELKNFILPKGNRAVSTTHICRTIARRAEIQVLECDSLENQVRLNPIRIYLNRLSDYFFVLARYIGHREEVGETIWKN
jgi:cob(I)alamin adenosyltransferase